MYALSFLRDAGMSHGEKSEYHASFKKRSMRQVCVFFFSS